MNFLMTPPDFEALIIIPLREQKNYESPYWFSTKKIKITERHLPSFVVLVDQTPVWGPPEPKNDGAGPTESCLPTHRVLWWWDSIQY